MKKLVLWTFVFAPLFLLGKTHCTVCRMDVEENPKTRFESSYKEKPVHFCSFTCARQFRKKQKQAKIVVHDFLSGEKVEGEKAYFLVKSENVTKELAFGMPPSVVGFGKMEEAQKVQKRLGDGKIVRGFYEVEKVYE